MPTHTPKPSLELFTKDMSWIALVMVLLSTHSPICAAQDWQGLPTGIDDYALSSPLNAIGPEWRQTDNEFSQSGKIGMGWYSPLELTHSLSPFPWIDGDLKSSWVHIPVLHGFDYTLQWTKKQETFGYDSDSNGIALQYQTQYFRQTLRMPITHLGFMGGHWSFPNQSSAHSQGAGWFLQFGDPSISEYVYGFESPKKKRMFARYSMDWNVLPITHSAYLKGYENLLLPGRVEIQTHELQFGYTKKNLGGEWRGRWIHFRPLPENESVRTTSTRAWLMSQGGTAHWNKPFQLSHLNLAFQGDGTLGYGTEKGFQSRAGAGHPFVNAPWDMLAARAAIITAYSQSDWVWKMSWQIESLRARLLQPISPADHWLWNRNQILDAYQGAITGLFDRETWLGLGRLEAWEWDFGLQSQKHLRLSQLEMDWIVGMDFHRVIANGWARLTQYQTQLLLSTQETRTRYELETLDKWLVQPSLKLRLQKDSWSGTAGFSQAIPISFGEDNQSNTDVTPSNSAPSQKSIAGGQRWQCSIQRYFSLPLGKY